jgi:hypothetical protein
MDFMEDITQQIKLTVENPYLPNYVLKDLNYNDIGY